MMTARTPRESGEATSGALPPAFAVERAPLSGAPGVRVSGEVDVDTVPELVACLDAAMRETRGAFVIDLCDVTFLDSSGVSVLVHARAFLGREDRDLAVICPPGSVRRILEVTNLADLLVLFESRDEAMASLRPAT
jgi:anti-sigma B factor antagonist